MEVIFKPIEAELEGEYWELSPSMLSKAIKNLRQSNLSFHLGHFNSLSEFDLIFLPFVLDTMGDQEMLKFLEKVKKKCPVRRLTHPFRFFLSFYLLSENDYLDDDPLFSTFCQSLPRGFT